MYHSCSLSLGDSNSLHWCCVAWWRVQGKVCMSFVQNQGCGDALWMNTARNTLYLWHVLFFKSFFGHCCFRKHLLLPTFFVIPHSGMRSLIGSIRINPEQTKTFTQECSIPLRLPDIPQPMLKLQTLSGHCHCLTQWPSITHILIV